MKNYVLTLCCCVMLVMACSDDDAAPAKDKTPLLTAADWTIAEVRVDDKTKTFVECFWANVFTFSDDGTYDVMAACPVIGGAPTGTWTFQSNQTKFTWDYETGIPESTVFDIVTLNEDIFEVEANGGSEYIRFEAVK